MKRIYKYPIFDIRHLVVDQGTFVQVKIPKDAEHLGSHLQGTMIVHYAAVEPDVEEYTHTFYVIGTGYPVAEEVNPEEYTYSGTFSVHLSAGLLVAHVFHKMAARTNEPLRILAVKVGSTDTDIAALMGPVAKAG